MKKYIIIFVAIIIILLISGYVENSYCHYFATTPPLGNIDKNYIHTTGFCKLNSYISLPGGLLLGLFN